MKHLMSCMLLATTFALTSVPTLASGGGHVPPKVVLKELKKKLGDNKSKCGKLICKPGKVKSVPEIDAAGAGIALALLGGIFAVSRERRKGGMAA